MFVFPGVTILKSHALVNWEQHSWLIDATVQWPFLSAPEFEDTEDPYCETGHNALFIGPDGGLWSSCHYLMYEKHSYPYSQTFQDCELTPQPG
jgi:hypothetical protein